MSRPLKCSKFSEEREQENIDRISSLPDELIGDILSILPTRCAVATSILSSRWKCLHMLTNCLSFDVPYVMGQEAANAQKKSYRSFVDKVLSSHKVTPIKKFHLDCDRHNYVNSLLDTWIGVALSKRVEQLHLFLGRRPRNALPNCLFTSQSIVELKIDSHIEDLQVPESIQLPNLKSLDLSNIDFVDNNSFDRFFAACPLLQVLKIGYCIGPNVRHARISLEELTHLTVSTNEGRFEIYSPKLVYLKINNVGHAIIVLSLKNPERLVTALVDLNYIDNKNELRHALALLEAIRYVKELHLGLLIVKFISGSEDYRLPSFPNLVKLRLGRWSYKAWKYVTHLLGNSPRLETVVFNQGLNKGDKRGDKWPTNVVLAPFSSCVKVIEASRFFGYTRELVFVKYLLANADELNLLILKKCMTEKQALDVHKKLLKFPRASKTCEIQLGKE